MGNRKQAIKDIREAIRRGLKSPQLLEQDPNLEVCADNPGNSQRSSRN
jgi:hypothetical protein